MKPGERYLRPEDLRRLQNFELAAKQIVDGFYAGRHRSPRYDSSAEFADYRPYVPGDDVRSIDWRAAARTDRDYVKLYRKEADRRCQILLDSSASMAFRDEQEIGDREQGTGNRGEEKGKRRKGRGKREEGRGIRARILELKSRIGLSQNPKPKIQNSGSLPLSKFEYGAYLSAALCWLTLRQGDRAGLGIGGDRLQTFLPAGGAMPHLRRMLLALEQTEPGGKTELSAALRGLFAASSGRGLLIVISDFLEPTEPLFDALAMFAHRGEKILLFHVLTETELDLPEHDGPARYRDAESTAFADADSDTLRPAYHSALREWLTNLETQAKARGIRYERLSTAAPYDAALENYLTGKKTQKKTEDRSQKSE